MLLPDDNMLRKQAERQAVNTVIQGSASDVIKYAMLSLENEIDKTWVKLYGSELRPCLLLQIHDELIYESYCDKNDPSSHDKFIELAKNCMETLVTNGLRFTVPLTVKVCSGYSWGNMKSHDFDSEPPLQTNASVLTTVDIQEHQTISINTSNTRKKINHTID